MISLVIIMVLFWHYQKLSQLDPGVKISYIILTPPRYFQPPQIIDDKVLFVAHICLIRSINILTSWMISCLSSANAFNFCTTKNYPNLTIKISYQGVKIPYDILTTHPPPPTPQPLIINYNVLFAFHIYSRRCIIISKSY